MSENPAKRINFQQVFILTGIISLIIVYLIEWIGIMTDPVLYTGADFIAFYAAGKVSQNEGPAHIYDLDLIHKYQQEVVGFPISPVEISPFLHPPYELSIIKLVTLNDFVLSFKLWNLIMLCFFILGTVVLVLSLTPEIKKNLYWLVGLGFLLFFPNFVGLSNGQDNAILFLGAALFVFGLVKEKDWLGGIGLAIMTIRPHLTLLLVVPFLFKRRKIFWYFLLGAFALFLISFINVGVGGIEGFLKVILVSGSGVSYHTGENHMFNIIGILYRLFPSLPASIVHGIDWVFYILAIIGLSIYWVRSNVIGGRQVTLAVFLALLTSPHTHIHDLVLLIIPVIFLIKLLIRSNTFSEKSILTLPLIVSYGLLLGFFSDLIKYSLTYVIMLLLFLPVWNPQKFLAYINLLLTRRRIKVENA